MAFAIGSLEERRACLEEIDEATFASRPTACSDTLCQPLRAMMSLGACTRFPYDLLLIDNASDERMARYVDHRGDYLRNAKRVKNDSNPELGRRVAS